MSLSEAQKREASLIVFACLSREDLLWELLCKGGNSKKWMELGFTEVPLKAIRESLLENEAGERRNLGAVLRVHDYHSQALVAHRVYVRRLHQGYPPGHGRSRAVAVTVVRASGARRG